MTISIKLQNQSAGNVKIKGDFRSYILDYPCSDPTYCTPYIVTLSANKYKFELWGAEGGFQGGKGGYTTGILYVKEETIFYFFIGAKGPELVEQNGKTPPAYNGGTSGRAAGNKRCAGSGGGSTDVRVLGDTVYYRILVAGAGGGGDKNIENGYISYGGSGGGLVGKNSTSNREEYIAFGATQEGPGKGQEEYGGNSTLTHSGIFGAGGYGTFSGTHGGGGSGWFGGAGGAPGYLSGGGGGSGYVLTDSSFRPIDYEHNSSKSFYFRNGKTLDGDKTFRDCFTNLIVPGHSGNGCAKITVFLPFTFQCRKMSLSLNLSFVLIFLLYVK